MAYDAARGRTVLFGGFGAVDFGDTWEWDGATWTAVDAGFGPGPLDSFGLSYDTARRRTVLFGGHSGTVGERADTWEWDGATWIRLDAG